MTVREQMIEAVTNAVDDFEDLPKVLRAERVLDALTPGLVWDWLVETGYVKQVGVRNVKGQYLNVEKPVHDDGKVWNPVYEREDYSQKFGVQRDYPGMSGLPVEES